MTTPILLLSGAGLPTWIWDDVRAALPAESRVAPRPPGAPSLADHARCALAEAAGWDRFVVVAHSAGGVVAAELLATAPDRVAGVVAVAAIVPPPGRSFLGALPLPQRLLVSALMRVLGTRPPAKQIRDDLAAGVDAGLAQRLVDDFEPESQAYYRDRVGDYAAPRAATYVLTGRDSLAAALQEEYAARLGADLERIDTGHLPMLEQPRALAGLIAAARIGA